MIRSIRWNGNALFAGLLKFIRKMPKLETLSLSKCPIPPHTCLDSLTDLALILGERQIQALNISYTFARHGPKFLTHLYDALVNHPTLSKLDMSGNLLGEAGLKTLTDILQGNPRITRLAFDEIGLKTAEPLQRLFEVLEARPSIAKVKRPGIEFRTLAEVIDKQERRALKQAWDRLVIRAKAESATPTDESTADLSGGLSDAIVYQSAPVLQALPEDWDVKVPSSFMDTREQWRALRRMFTFEMITGVATGLKPDEDLLCFDVM
jgi:hypothetical protein